MSDLWLADAQRIAGNSAGAMNGDGSRKLLLHSTEGSSIDGAVSAYRAHNSWPTLTVDCPRRRVVEHMPLNVAARALKNKAGGVETNREGSVLVQIEMVGFAERPASIGDPDDLDWFGSKVVGPIARLTGVPLVSTVTWAPYPRSYGERAAQRLSAAAWDAYSGVCGHQHAAENDHGDPGLIDITRILRAAGGNTPVEEDMTPNQAETLDNIAQRLIRMEDDLKAVRGRPPGYFAKVGDDGTVYYVAADHQSKLDMAVGGDLHEWLKGLHKLSGFGDRAVVMTAAQLDGIPDAS